jgi:hypothetical protein
MGKQHVAMIKHCNGILLLLFFLNKKKNHYYMISL